MQIYQEDHIDEMEIINLHKRCNKTKVVAKTSQKAPKSGYDLFLREQPDVMTGEDRRTYRSIVSRKWKETKEDPARLSEYNDRARQMQNEKTPTSKHPPKIQKTTEFVDTDSDNTDNEQEPAAKQPQKAPKTPEYVDTYSGDMDDEQGPAVKQPKKVLKTPEFADTDSDDMDDEKGPAVNYHKCIVMYSTENEQEPAVKQP